MTCASLLARARSTPLLSPTISTKSCSQPSSPSHLHNFELLVPLQSGFASPFQQIADDFMTDRRDANLLSLLYQLDDHVRAGVRLARAWRTLNGKHRSVEQ